MSQNPYAAYNTNEPMPEARTSMLAILSLVCSLICCIPGLSILGTLLGAVAILRISGSNGRRKGTGLAIAGIVIGLFISVCYIGGYAALSTGIKQMMGVGAVVTENIDSTDAAALRKKLPADVADRLPDAQWQAFRSQIDAEIGTPLEPLPNNPFSYMSQLMTAFSEHGQASGNGPRRRGSQSADLPPVPLKGPKGVGVMLIELDGDPLPDTDGNLSILRQVTVYTGSGKTIKLFLEPGETTPSIPAPTTPKRKPADRTQPEPADKPANGV